MAGWTGLFCSLSLVHTSTREQQHQGLGQLQCGSLHKFSANLMFSVSTLVLIGVSFFTLFFLKAYFHFHHLTSTWTDWPKWNKTGMDKKLTQHLLHNFKHHRVSRLNFMDFTEWRLMWESHFCCCCWWWWVSLAVKNDCFWYSTNILDLRFMKVTELRVCFQWLLIWLFFFHFRVHVLKGKC